MQDPEHRLQCACVRWFRYQYPELSSLLFAVPNGGRRDPVTGARLKAEGVVAGVSDLILFLPSDKHHALCIEMKTPKGRQSPSQKEWQQQVERYGYRYEVIRDFLEFEKLVKSYIQEVCSNFDGFLRLMSLDKRNKKVVSDFQDLGQHHGFLLRNPEVHARLVAMYKRNKTTQ